MRGERRRWTDATKRMIVAECEVEGVSAASVARRYKISAQHLALWRRDPRFNGAASMPDFYPVEISDALGPEAGSLEATELADARSTANRCAPPSQLEIQFPCGAKIVCPDEAALVMAVRAVRRA